MMVGKECEPAFRANLPCTKRLSEDIVDLHKAGKSYNSISKSLNVHQSTVRQTVEVLLLLSLSMVIQ